MPARSAPDTVSSHAHACPTPCLELRLLAARRRSNSLAVSPRGCSSAGRAAALQAVGRGFESLHLHDVMSKNFHDVMSKNFGDVGTWGVCGAWRRRSGGGPTRDTAEKRRALERWLWKRRCRLQLRGPGRPGASLLRDVGTRQSENPEQFRLKARRSSDETPGWGGDCDVQVGARRSDWGIDLGTLSLTEPEVAVMLLRSLLRSRRRPPPPAVDEGPVACEHMAVPVGKRNQYCGRTG